MLIGGQNLLTRQLKADPGTAGIPIVAPHRAAKAVERSD